MRICIASKNQPETSSLSVSVWVHCPPSAITVAPAVLNVACQGQRQPLLCLLSTVLLYTYIYVFPQVCSLAVVVQHAVSGQGSQAAAVPSLCGEGTLVKMCAPIFSCRPCSHLWEALERWQKVGGFSIQVRKTTNLLSSKQMWSPSLFCCMFVYGASLLSQDFHSLILFLCFVHHNRLKCTVWCMCRCELF